MFLGAAWFGITIVSIWNHHVYRDFRSDLSFLVILDFSLAGVLAAFNGWNWFLALTGYTTIEFWQNMSMSERSKQETFDYSFGNAMENLFVIFGTQKIIRILSPSLSNSPLTGLEFSFVLHDEGYDCEGEKINDKEMQELPEVNEATNEETKEAKDSIQSAFAHQLVEDDINEGANTAKNLETIGSIFGKQEIEMEELKG